MPLSRGTRLGPYEILSPLGAGGMGEVYRAHDLKLKRTVAIKVLSESLSHDAEALLRFEREAVSIAALSHPNILAIHDFGFENGVAYAVMELLEGETLREKLVEGPIPAKQAVDYAAQVARGLSAAHEKGIVHRDLKPENLFVTKDGHLKILDFGLAKRVDAVAPSEETSAPTVSSHTLPGTVMGTVGYMSPEQVRGLPIDHRSDIFSFGAILYELLTGKKAFGGATPGDTMAAILRDEPPDPAESERKIPLALDHILRHCLEKNRDNRFQTARDIAFSLSEQSLLALVREPAAAAPPARKTMLLLGGTLVILVAVAFAATLLTRRKSSGAGEAAGGSVRGGSIQGAITSLAVLPFDNGSKDSDAEYLSDGLTESLIRQLSRIPSLKVMARATVFRFKGSSDPLGAGKTLGVGAVVTGSIVRRGDRLSVSAELVEVGSGVRLWGERYDRPFAEVLRVQDNIASDISDGLRLKLSGEERRRLGGHGTQNAEAYALYLQAQHEAVKDTEEGYLAARRLYQRAIEIDERYADAHLGLSSTYGLMAVGGYERPSDAWPLSDAEAKKTLAIDPSQADATADLAFRRIFFDWDWEGGESQLKQAFREKRMHDATRAYALFLWATGRTEDAIAVLERERDADPGNIVYAVAIADYSSQAGRFDRAVDFYGKAIALDPSDPRPFFGLAQLHRRRGEIPAAIEALRKAYDLSRQPELARRFERAHTARDLEAVEASATRAQLAELRELAKTRYISPLDLARAHAQLGERDAAFHELVAAFADRSPGLVLLKVDPAWDRIRDDPRFAAMVERLRLP